MSYFLCAACIGLGYCRKMTTRLVPDRKLENPDYLRDLRAFTSGLQISPDHWHEYVIGLYRDYAGVIVANGREVFLDTDVFEIPGIREWFRDYICTPVPDGVRPRLREETRERLRILASILSTRYPFESSMWGVRPANDNQPPAGQ